MYNYSIIIPHRNTPDLLKRMLNSIPPREDTEIIIVDDNSDLDKVNFSNFPGLHRENTRCIFTKEGYGAGYARNVGLTYATGYWIYFADADDYFTPNVEKLFNQYSMRKDIDMVFVNALMVDEQKTTRPLILNRYIKNSIAKRKHSQDVLRFGFWAPWSRLIKRSIFIDNGIKFEHVAIGNDMMGIIQSSIFAKTFDTFEKIVYMYYKPIDGSQTDHKYGQRNYICRLKQKLVLNNIYRKYGYPYLWPITRGFYDSTINKSPEVKAILEEYSFSKSKDIIIYIKYIAAKLIHRI